MLGVIQKEQKSANRFYLRYHNSISRAIELNQEIFGNSVGKDGKEPRFEHSIRVAGFSQEIMDQNMDEYHQCWLLGILHDNKQHNPLLYSQRIDHVLKDLYPQEQELMKKYVDVLTSDKTLSKGQQKYKQIEKAEKMNLVPTWILIFDKYDNCRRFKANPCGKSKEELNGYFSVAYLIYLRGKERYTQIRDFCPTEIRQFYEKLGKELGGEDKAIEFAEMYCEKY